MSMSEMKRMTENSRKAATTATSIHPHCPYVKRHNVCNICFFIRFFRFFIRLEIISKVDERKTSEK